MITRVVARYIRVSPRKTRKVIDLIRGLPVLKAEAILDFTNKRPTGYVKRLLKSAVDSADKKFNIAPSDLYISSIRADQGPTLKRYRAASMGRASMVRHRTTHLSLELEKIKVQVKKTAKEDMPAVKGQEKKTRHVKAQTKKAKPKRKKSAK